MSIKIFKINYFSFPFKLNEKKVPLKKIGLESGGYKKIFARGGVDPQQGGLEIFKKNRVSPSGGHEGSVHPSHDSFYNLPPLDVHHGASLS